MRRSPSTAALALLLSATLLSAGCPMQAQVSALRDSPVDLECVDACEEFRDDCTGAQAASTFLLIPAYIIAIVGVLILIGGGGGGGNCGGVDDLGSAVSCRKARDDCVRACPAAGYPDPNQGVVR